MPSQDRAIRNSRQEVTTLMSVSLERKFTFQFRTRIIPVAAWTRSSFIDRSMCSKASSSSTESESTVKM